MKAYIYEHEKDGVNWWSGFWYVKPEIIIQDARINKRMSRIKDYDIQRSELAETIKSCFSVDPKELISRKAPLTTRLDVTGVEYREFASSYEGFNGEEIGLSIGVNISEHWNNNSRKAFIRNVNFPLLRMTKTHADLLNVSSLILRKITFYGLEISKLSQEELRKVYPFIKKSLCLSGAPEIALLWSGISYSEFLLSLNLNADISYNESIDRVIGDLSLPANEGFRILK